MQELDDEEYATTKQETMDQLKEFRGSLERMSAGETTLLDDIGRMKAAIQAAISQAFKAPEVIKLFALKQPKQLREHLAMLQRDRKLNAGKVDTIDAIDAQVGETLGALKSLGEALSPEEEEMLHNCRHENLALFEAVEEDIQVDHAMCKNLNAKVERK